ncbi:MAG: hypothetical protein HYU28_06010 [Actinobacteria bacterium]|nr:hypothetical protein [Actinomycetota bacterium]
MAALASACSSGADSPPESGGRRPGGKACDLLSREEVESFMGERAHEGQPDDPSEGLADTCRWGDADPAAPGRILSLALVPAASVDQPRPAEGDQSYELPELGEDAIGLQQAAGGVRVSFTAEGSRIDMEYDIVPISAAESDAIDRLARLAGRVRGRLLTAE